MRDDARERELVAARRARRDVEADVVAALAQPPLDLVEQARLADAVVAADGEHARRALGRGGEHLADAPQLVLASDEAAERLARPAHVFHEDAGDARRRAVALRRATRTRRAP